MKYSYDDRLSVITLIKEEHLSLRAAGSSIGAHEKDVRSWLHRYDLYGEAGLRLKNGTYSGEFKLSVIRDMRENHLSLFETAAKYGIPSDRTLRAWLRIYDCEGAEKFFRETRGRMKKKSTPPKQPSEGISEDMVLELNRLRAEVAYLKKLRALVEERIAQEKKIGHKPLKN